MLTIYKITIYGCDLLYIGSTTNFTQRKAQHKDFAKHYFNPNQQLYYKIRECGGWDKCVMEIIEEQSTLEREQYWINHFGNLVFNNRNPNGMTAEQKKERRDVNAKRWYDKVKTDPERNKKLQEYRKEYYLKNKK